jgi:AraC family transcriptional regulator
VRALERGPCGPLEVEERALALFADVLAASFALRDAPRAVRKRDTHRDHVDRAEAAKAFLAERLGERLGLADVARAVHVSPFHLARIFERHAGMPLHRYLTKLRLRTALERLHDGERSIAALATDLGFSSHGHFTEAFKREFGFAPSRVRGDSLETSKDPEV